MTNRWLFTNGKLYFCNQQLGCRGPYIASSGPVIVRVSRRFRSFTQKRGRPSRWSASIILLRGQDLWTFGGDGDRMLVLGGELAVQRPGGPTVRIDCHVVGAFGDHGLDREHHAFLDAEAFAGVADMHIVRILVQVLTDAMGEKVAHDAEAVRFGMPLDRTRHVAEPIAGLCLRDAEVKAFLRDAHQLLGRR